MHNVQTSNHPNLSGLYIDLSRSLKVKCNDSVGHPVNDFVLVEQFNCKIWLISSRLRIIDFKMRVALTLTFRGDYPASNVMVQLGLPIV